jgi:cell division protein FtsL
MMLYLIVLIVLIFLILELLYKFGKHIEISEEFERKLTSDIESLNESLNSIKDEIYKRKE